MPTVNKLVERYDKYSNAEILELYRQIDAYSEEAKEAIKICIENRGGLERIKNEYNRELDKEKERERVRQQVIMDYQGKQDFKNLIEPISSGILSAEEIEQITSDQNKLLLKDERDRKIKPRTLIGGLLGALIGGIVGGIGWGLQLVYSGRMFVILALGLAVLCYGFVWLFTRQSRKNIAVLIFTILSISIALFIGIYFFKSWGIADHIEFRSSKSVLKLFLLFTGVGF